RRRGAAAPPRLRDAGPRHDPEALPQRARPADGARAVLPPRHPSADRAAHASRPRRARRQGARARRLPDLRPRLPPVRRRRLGRLRLPLDVLDPRLRADHRPHPYAAAVAPDVRGPELRHLLVLPAQARLRPAGGPDPLPPLEPAERGDDLLRRRQLLVAQGDRGRLDHPPPLRAAARPAAGPRREEPRHDRDARVRRHVRHVPSAAPLDARRRPRRRPLHVLLGGGRPGAERRPGRRRHVPPLSLLRIPEPYDFELSTGRFRMFGTDLANRLLDGALHRVVGGREVLIRPRPGGVDVEPLDDATRPAVERLLGLPFDLAAFAAWAAREPVLAPIADRLRGYRPPLQPDPFEALVTSITAQQVSLFSAVAIRNRLIERLGERVGEAWAFPSRARIAAASEDDLVAAGFTRRKAESAVALARSALDLDELA